MEKKVRKLLIKIKQTKVSLLSSYPFLFYRASLNVTSGVNTCTVCPTLFQHLGASALTITILAIRHSGTCQVVPPPPERAVAGKSAMADFVRSRPLQAAVNKINAIASFNLQT